MTMDEFRRWFDPKIYGRKIKCSDVEDRAEVLMWLKENGFALNYPTELYLPGNVDYGSDTYLHPGTDSSGEICCYSVCDIGDDFIPSDDLPFHTGDDDTTPFDTGSFDTDIDVLFRHEAVRYDA